jgi:GTP-binding protein
VVADVPGLIPGASEGKGLGHDFLRHIERTRILIHLIDASQSLESMKADYESILNEMGRYAPELLERNRLTVLSKSDAAEGDAAIKKDLQSFQSFLKKRGETALVISAALRTGISEVLDKIVEMIRKMQDDHSSMADLLK